MLEKIFHLTHGPVHTTNNTKNKLTRRDFNGLMVKTALSLLIGAEAIEAAKQPFLPELFPETSIPYPQPGWLETMPLDTEEKRPLFIKDGQGHKDYLKYFCKYNPVVNTALKSALADFFSQQSTETPLLGDALDKHVEFAKAAIIKHKETLATTPEAKKLFDDDTEPSLANCLHVAAFTFAATYSPYFTYDEMVDFGVTKGLPEPKNKNDWWLEDHHGGIPHVLPIPEKICNGAVDNQYRCEGADRAVHFAQHFFLTHQYYYLLQHQLQDRWRIPIGAWFLSNPGERNEVRAISIDTAAQYYWEWIETLEVWNGKGTKDGNGFTIPSGFLDPAWSKDIDANNLGMMAALVLRSKDISQGQIDNARQWLNMPFVTAIDELFGQPVTLDGATVDTNSVLIYP